MTNLLECSPPLSGKAIVLSVKPKYADLILAGTKTVEFRRSWAAKKVDMIVIYSSAPIQRLVGVVKVQDVVRAPKSTLWMYCATLGGGLLRRELRSYFEGKPRGYAIFLEGVQKFDRPLIPQSVFDTFVPPQSFRYLTDYELDTLERRRNE